MPDSIDTILKEFTRRVRNLLGDRVKKILLYGSYARGDYNEHSDVDVMILTDLDEKEIESYRDEVSDIAFDIELKTTIAISPIIKNINKYNVRKDIIPFFENVEKEGVVL